MAKYTSKDIERVASFMRHAKDTRPFALVTGAGCSIAAGIPLASALIKEINTSPRFEAHIAKLTPEQRNDYGKLMACLGKNDRKALLSPYLDTAKVNWAHIAIASMMSAGYVTRTLTFNFDNVLARACGICGLYPATYDFVTGVSNATDHIVTPAIIHLHGQGYGLAMLNSDRETADHAHKLRPLLSQTLRHFPVLVIGYSGQADAVFPVMKDEFDGSERLLWAGFSDEPASHIQNLVAKHETLADYFGGADADRFLVELAQMLGCFPPTIFKDPIKHIRDEIAPVTAFPTSGTSGSNVDVLAALHSTLDYLATDITTEPKLRASLDLMTGNNDAIVAAWENGEAIPSNLVVSALANQGYDFLERARTENDTNLLDNAAAKYEAALKIKPDHYDALNNWGVALSDKAKTTGDASLFDEAVAKFEAALKIKPDRHDALNNWGVALSRKGAATGDASMFEDAAAKFEAALKIKPDHLNGLNNSGVALSRKAEATGDTSLFDEAAAKFEAALKIKPDHHEVLNNWGIALTKKAAATGDTSLFDEAAAKYEAALKIKPSEAYNVACLSALKGNSQAARIYLERCREAGTLPSKSHMKADRDLESLRDEDWFKALVEE